jgi:hypothetical protein
MDFRSFDRLLPSSGTPLSQPKAPKLHGAGVGVERAKEGQSEGYEPASLAGATKPIAHRTERSTTRCRLS